MAKLSEELSKELYKVNGVNNQLENSQANLLCHSEERKFKVEIADESAVYFKNDVMLTGSSSLSKNIFFGCEQCPNKYNCQEMLDRHINLVHGANEDFAIAETSKAIKVEPLAIDHQVSFDSNSTNSVDVYSEPGLQEPIETLVSFEETIKIDPTFPEPISNKLKTNEGTPPSNQLTSEQTHSCEKCRKVFKTSEELIIHSKTHSEEHSFSCRVCHKKFANISKLKRHMNMHSDERPYSCPTCDKGFTTNSLLNRHMKIHSNELPFRCEMCDKSFVTNGQLKLHVRTHLDERPYSCETCNESYPTNDQLKIHVRRKHTGERPFTCGTCHKSFVKSSNLNSHMKTHLEKLFSCGTCPKRFATHDQYKVHMKNHAAE